MNSANQSKTAYETFLAAKKKIEAAPPYILRERDLRMANNRFQRETGMTVGEYEATMSGAANQNKR